MRKHTQGEWDFLRQGKEVQGFGGHEVIAVVNGIHVLIAEIPVESHNESEGKNYHICKGEALANGKLLAAAPRLLEAAKGLLERYCELVNSGDCGNWNPELDDEVVAMRLAIKEASR